MADEIVVQIEKYADGRILVGQISPEAEEGGAEEQAAALMPPEGQEAQTAAPTSDEGQDAQMREVGSVDEALQIARQLLGADKEPTGAAAEAQFAKGFGKQAAPSMIAR